MTDNVSLNTMTGGDTVAAKDVSGIKYQRVILSSAIGGTQSDVTDVSGLPVTLASLSPGTLAANLGKAEDAAHSSGDVGVMVLAVRNDAGTVLAGTTGDYIPFTTDATGAVRVTGSGGTSMADDAAFTIATTSVTPIAGTYRSTLDSVDDGDAGALAMTQKRALYVSHLTPNGDAMVDDTLDALNVKVVGGSIAAITDDAAFGVATSDLLPVGFLADEIATDSVNEGDIGAARITLDRKFIVTDYAHAAAGGDSSYSALSTAAVLTAQIKGSAGKVYSVQIFNLNAAARYVRLYDQTGAPASTDGANIVWRGIIPGLTTGAGFAVQFPKGKQFATGIGIRASAAVADNDTTVLAANELAFNVDYI